MTLRARWNHWLRGQPPLSEIRHDLRSIKMEISLLADALIQLQAKPTATTDPTPATKMTPSVDPHLGRL